jgi:ubiquinone/menaquinone biosynthesis C-methylase UbiE
MTKKPKTKLVALAKEEPIVPLRLDLGCGQNCKVGEDGVKFTGVDYVKCDGVDIVHDLTKFPYPFEDSSVDEVFTSHFLEHLDGPERIQFFTEMYRIMKPGGKMTHIHPYYKSVRAIQDPTHKFPPIGENSYLYWDKTWRAANKLDHYKMPVDLDFDFNIFYTFQDALWANKSEEARNFAINHYFNVVADMIVHMKKR